MNYIKTLLAVCMATICMTAAAELPGGDRLVTLRLADEPLPSALKKIERSGGKSILFTYAETERYRVTAYIQGKTQAEALALVLKGKPFKFVERDIYFVVQYSSGSSKGHGVSGRVTDEQGRPLAFANVVMLTAAGRKYVTGCVTADDGTFALPDMPSQECVLKVSFVGYGTAIVPCRADNTIALKDETRQLKGVTVTNNRPMIERKGGNIVANVAGTALAQMGSADDMIGHLPFVTGEDGSYSVIGRGAVEVYMNGRKVRDKDELSRIQASDIQQAELIMNPGARYSSDVGAVIRLKTIRLRGQGLSGQMYGEWTQSRKAGGRENVALNYRTGGLDVFLKGNFRENGSLSDISRVSTMTTSSLWRMETKQNNSRRAANFKGEAGFNYEPDDHQSFGVRYELSRTLGREKARSWGNTTVYRDGELFDDIETNSYNESADGWNHSVNAYYTATFGRWDIDFNADYVGGNSRSWQTAANNGTTDAESYNDVDNDLYAAKLVVSAPLWKGTLAFGTEETFTDRRDRFVQSGFSADADDHLRQEYYSAFADYTVTLGRFSLQAGLRYEHQRTKYYEAGVFKSEQSPTYNDFLPSATASYSHGDWNLALSYRLMKLSPSYDMLSSAVSYMSKYMYENGDPLLVPQKHHMVTLDGGWRWINFTIWYDYCLNMYTSYFKPYNDETHPGVMLQTMASIPYTNQYGASINLTPKFGIYQPSLSAGVNWYDSDATSLGIPYLKNQACFDFRLDNSFVLPKGWFVNLKATYSTRATMSYAIDQPRGKVDLRVAKTFFKDKSLKIGFNVDDIFNTGRYRFTVYGDHTYYDTRNEGDSRRIKLSLTYTFNATKSKYKGTGAGQAEKQRL